MCVSFVSSLNARLVMLVMIDRPLIGAEPHKEVLCSGQYSAEKPCDYYDKQVHSMILPPL